MFFKKIFGAAGAIFVLFLIMSMSACSQTPKDPTGYTAESFSAEVSFERGGVIYAARVIAGDKSSAENGVTPPRDLEISFTAPESMAGIGARRREGVTVTSCGGVELEGDVAGWLGLAELLIPSDIGKLISVEAGRGAAEGRTMAEFLLNDGRRCVIYIDNASGLPISVECGEDEIGIIFNENK